MSESPSQRAGSVEGAITAAEQRYRLLIDRLPAVTYLARVEPHADLYVSPQVEALLGFTQAEWLANPALWVERLHPDDCARVRAAWEAAQAGGGPFRSEYQLLGRDGRAVWVRDEARVVRDEADGPPYLLGVMQDVTERKRVEEVLRASEARFRMLAQSLPEAVYEADMTDPAMPSGAPLFFSDRLEGLMGYPLERWYRRPYVWLEGLHPDDRDWVLEAHDELRERGETLEIQYRWVKPSGEVVWIEDRMRLQRGPRGEPLLLRGTNADVTARAESERHGRGPGLKAVIDPAPEVIVRFDRELRYVYVNPAAERVLGAPTAAILGKAAGELHMAVPVARAWRLTLRQVFATGREQAVEVTMSMPAGERTYQIRAAPEFAPDGSVASVIAVSRDITERARWEDEQKRLYQELLQREERLHELVRRALLAREDEQRRLRGTEELGRLTARERQVLQPLARGLTNREIGRELGVSPTTVKAHVAHILAKLGVADRTQAAVKAVQLGL